MEGKIDTLKDIWQGYLQFGLSQGSRQIYFLADLILSLVIIYLLIRPFNNRRGINYLALILVAGLLLVATAYFTLPSLHLLLQLVVIILLIGLPIYFEDIWLNLFRPSSIEPTNQSTKYLGKLPRLIVSLLLALTLVLSVNGLSTKTSQLPQDIVIAPANIKEGLAANLGSDKKVSLIITAPRSRWQQLSADAFSASIDLGDRSEGTYDLPINVTAKVGEVKVVRIKPERITVTVEPVIKKTVAVVVNYTGKAANDLLPGEAKIDPAKVEVSGAKSVITDLSQAQISVNLDNQTQAIEQKYGLTAVDSGSKIIEGLTFSPSEVAAKIPLIKAGKNKTVGIKPKLTGQPAGGYWVSSIEVDPPAITVTGPVDLLQDLSQLETESVSLAGLSADTTVNVNLSYPSGISSVGEVRKVNLSIKVSPTSTTKVVNPELIFDGLSSGLKVTNMDPAQISAIVSGSSALLADGEKSKVKIVLDLSAYKSAGNYSLTIKNTNFQLPSGLTLVSFLPSALSITLENK